MSNYPVIHEETIQLKLNAEKVYFILKKSQNRIHQDSCWYLQNYIINSTFIDLQSNFNLGNNICCPLCHSTINFYEFDFLSLKEWGLSQMCLKCQDNFFD